MGAVNHRLAGKYLARSRISFKSLAPSQKSVVHAGHQITVFVKSIGRGDQFRRSMVFPSPLEGKRAVPSPVGTGAGKEVLDYRFKGKHHRGIDLSKAEVREEMWGGSRARNVARGLEHLYWERAVEIEKAANQNSPIRTTNPNRARYLQAAREAGATPCP
jgi:hypothetical protein